jgi:protein-S-isoprenylcysteine O-methyltransferase Ste14
MAMISSLDNVYAYQTTTFHVPLPLVLWPIPFALPFWAIYLWTRFGERAILLRDGAGDGTRIEDDRSSWAVINYGSKLAKAAALVAALTTPQWGEGQERFWIYGVGLLLMASGTSLRRYCFRLLGRYFTYQVTVDHTHAIVKAGIYRWVRHPSYTGGILYNVGIGVALTNKASALCLALGMMLVYVYRVHVEEAALLRVHGGSYKEYMQHTTRFIPFLL